MKKSKHIIFMTIDGVRPDGFAQACTTVMAALIKTGASTRVGTTTTPLLLYLYIALYSMTQSH